ncbi:mediator complex subunit MED14-domain-containing protein [Exophiala viscosa]|uniref:mediator complex subunit MED14-domain-containing protein n=1 Tax=Exophiala viscosa TaxID=2486360 RepID=UPI00219D4145|nr:mediator complex subunit MED14-domain-containing protein [Exophiala viscosa]
MNGDRPMVNGAHIQNGVPPNVANPAPDVHQIKQVGPNESRAAPVEDGSSVQVNGQHSTSQLSNGDLVPRVANGLEQAPQEILRLIPKDNYLPMAALISRASQSCWTGLTRMVEQLAAIHVPEQNLDQTKALPNSLPNNQTKANLDKKDRLLRFANDQKADFIKLLVLLEWSKNVEEVGKTISINFWLMRRRQAYWNTISSLALLKQESAGFQVPNPDLEVAAEVLSKGKVAKFPTLGYIPQKDLSPKQILRLLDHLNHALSVRLALSDDLPPQLRKFHIHDGRVTFVVSNEFELDVSILDESTDSPFRMVDFRFAFSPAPHIPDALHSEIERYSNSNIDRDGLQGCYLFLHELVLSYKLAEFHKQALELSWSQWAGNLRVEMIRRNLIVQYWTERPANKSWLEIGIASGRAIPNIGADEPLPCLEVKWMCRGKRAESLHLSLDESVLCFEDILRQVIAQHSTQVLDSVYDKLILSPLFSNAELSLEQTVSDEDPEECILTMQLSRVSHLQLKVDSVTGLLVISPVSERSERLQYEVNRVQSIADEIGSKLLNFRCSVMEAVVFAGIAGTRWEVMRAFKFNQAETKTLFGGPQVRINLFRQPQWGLGFFVAFTHAQNGDYLWLLQRSSIGGFTSQASFQVLRTQRIEVREELSSAWFERLGQYVTGVFSLQRNADYLTQQKMKFNLPPFPPFGMKYILPELTFEFDMATTGFSRQSGPPARLSKASSLEGGKTIKIRFEGIKGNDDRIETIARFRHKASSAALRYSDHLTKVKNMLIPANNVTFDSRSGMVTLRVASPVAEVAVPYVVEQATKYERNLATFEQVQRLPGLTLQVKLNDTFKVTYAPMGQETALDVTMVFSGGSHEPELWFHPPVINPHVLLTPQYARLFQNAHIPFAERVWNFLTSLTLTLPLLTFLHKLQKEHGIVQKGSQAIPQSSETGIRVHLLVRSATAFGLQYFTPARRVPQDVATNTQPHLLARLEILQHINSLNKPMWLVRAALEDFQSYSRPSYSTPSLRTKLRQEIFARADAQSKWLALDNAAACMADQPEHLLQAVHDVMCSWAKQSIETQAPGEDVKTQNGGQENLPNGTNKPKASGKTPGNSNAVPNGSAKQQRPLNVNTGRPAVAGKAPTGPLKNKEVITLD